MPAVLVTLDKLKDPNSGLGQFCLHLGRALAQLPDSRLRLTYLTPIEQFASFRELPVRLLPLRAWRKEKVTRLIRPVVPPMARPASHDLWHVTNQDAKYLPLDRGTPVLLTIHDLNYLRERSPAEQLQRTRRLQRKVDRATAVATISKFVAGEITSHLDLGNRPLRVIPNGVPAYGGVPQRPAAAEPGEFLFYIGHINPRKNLMPLVPMMEHLPDLKLFLAGYDRHDYAGEIQSEVARRSLSDRVKLLGEVSDAEREWLYRHCRALVFPSLTEGFGLPVLEAMQAGKPAFVSRATSLPEVAGELGWYWDEFGPEAMAKVVRQGLAAADSDSRLERRFKEHAARYSWRRAAESYAEWYRELAS